MTDALTPRIVGDIAHGTASFADLTREGARALGRHTLSYAACAASDAAGAPIAPDVEPILRAAARAQSLRSISVSATATQVCAVLAAAGIRSVAYKGPALSVQTTGSWLGRGSADVDVLIDPADCAATDLALREAGCTSRVGYEGPPGRWEQYHRPERAYEGLPVTVDLHWRVDPGPGYFDSSFDELWGRRERVECDGLDVQTLDRVDALLVTAVHGAKERWSRWSWALDAVRQVEQLDPSRWPEARIRARRTGSARALQLCVAVAQQCGARMPDGVGATPAVLTMAEEWLAASAPAGSVEWSTSASMARRRARWSVADSPRVALDGFARAVARLATDRRAPWSPQRRPSQIAG